jgi:hypothetical protein
MIKLLEYAYNYMFFQMPYFQARKNSVTEPSNSIYSGVKSVRTWLKGMFHS